MPAPLSLQHRFELGEPIGSGAAGDVYEGWDRFEAKRPVVLKIVSSKDQDSLNSIRRELRVLRRLQHPGLAQVLHVGPWDMDHWVLVSDRVSGTAIDRWASDLGQSSGAPTMHAALSRAMGHVCSTLAYVHAHDILHGDLKPPHVLVAEAGLPRLIDFGTAVEGSDAQFGGTVAYLAPESLRDGQRTPASDIYALGATVFAAVADTPPDVQRALRTDATTWHAHLEETLAASGVEGALRVALVACLSQDPTARPTARELAEELDPSWFAGTTPVAEPFVARDQELDALTSHWKHVLSEHTTGVRRVAGSPGVGTTRLVQEVTAVAESDGAIVLGGARVSAADPATEVLRQAAQLGIVPANWSQSTDQDRCLALLEGLANAPAETPIFLWLDGVTHGEDTLSERLLQRAHSEVEARAALDGETGPAWLLCATVEADTVADIHLGAFTAEEAANYISDAIPVPVERDVLDVLYRLSGGQVQALRNAVRGHWEHGLSLDELGEADLGASMNVARLVTTPQQRDLLEAVCCFDAPVISDLVLSACLTISDIGGEDRDTLVAHGLLRSDESPNGATQLSAPSPVRTTVRASASFKETCSRRHTAAAAWLEARASSAEERVLLGWQQLLAGNSDHGAQRVLEELSNVEDPRGTLTRLSKLELSDAVRAQVQRARAQWALGLGEPEVAVEQFRSLLSTEASRRDDVTGLARALTELGHYREALDTLPHGGSSTVQLLRARLLVYLGEYDAVAAEVADLRGLSPEEHARREEALALSEIYRGHHGAAVTRLRAALDGFDSANHPKVHAALQSALGMALQKDGKLREAQRIYEQTLRAIRDLGDRSREPARLINLGTLYQDEGQVDLALERYREAYAAAARLGHRRELVRVGYNQANLLLSVGAYDESLRMVDRALQHARDLEMQVEGLFLQLLRVECAQATGAVEDAKGLLESLEAEDVRSKHAIFERDIAVQRAHLAWAQGGHHVALGALADHRDGDAQVMLLEAEIRLSAQPKELDEAENLLSLARAEIDPKDDQMMFVLQTLEAQLAQGRGDSERHRSLTQRARETLERAALRIPARYRAGWRSSASIARLVGSLPDAPIQATTHGPAPTTSTSARDSHRRILQVNKRLARQTELTPLLELILDEAIDLAEAERGFILLRIGGAIRVVAARHLDMESLRKPESKFSHSLAEKVIQTGEPVVTLDALADDRFREQLSVHSLKLRSVVCAPLEVDSVVEGAVYLDNRFRENAFDDTVIDVLTAFADQAGLALKHARMRESLLERQRRLEASQAELETLNDQLQQRVEVTASQLAQATQLLSHERDEQQVRYKFSNIVSRSGAMTKALSLVDRLAGVDVSVVIHGESGTGKELIARALHNASPRATGPFVAINCAAIPETLLESELFGARKGAFTGADVDRPGLFKLAQGGTLFLDEVGDMPLSMQVKLLRVLENKTFRRLGDDRETETDVRVVAASNKDLQRLSDAGDFREDLFYRLNGATIRLPPLRDRAEDIQDLVPFLLERAAEDLRIAEVPPVAPLAMQALLRHDWPGNIRELDNALRQALALAEGVIEPSHLPPSMTGGANMLPTLTHRGRGSVFRRAVGDYEKQLIEAALEQTDTATSAAKMLGLSRSVFYAKAKRHGVSLPRDRDPN